MQPKKPISNRISKIHKEKYQNNLKLLILLKMILRIFAAHK